jgi:two-component SAPR family response regulator
MEQAHQFHVDAYLTKPFTRQHLTQVVDQLVRN